MKVIRVTCAIIQQNDQILVTQRSAQMSLPHKWEFPGGKIEVGEDEETCILREIKEELGLDISANNLKYITTAPNNYLYKNVPYRTMDIFYECNLEEDSISVNAKDEIEELIWIKRSEIDLDKIGFVSIRKVIGDNYLK